MTHPFQEELANALENLRNEREENARLQRVNNDLQNELERAQHLLFLAENPGGVEQELVPVTVMVPADQIDRVEQDGFDPLPFVPDDTFTTNHADN